MAVRISRATGNLTTAGTWGLIDSTSYNNDETTSTQLTTSYQASSGSTTGVITVDGIALKLSQISGNTGTMSVHLAIAGVEVPGSLVTINVTDLPVAVTADLNGGWIFFKFASPVVLAGATSYTVEAKTSSASQVTLFSTSGSNWARALSTTTTGAPAAGDDMIICGEYTGAGTSNTFTVTMDQTATTDYGAASTSLVTPAIAVCSKGILRNGIAAATNYNLKVSGNIVVYMSGEFDLGTTGTKMPRDSSMNLLFDCGANVDFGLTVRNLGTWVSQGLSRTSGKDIVSCKLNTDEAIASTSLGVNTDTGWLDNDAIAVASTTRTNTDCEAGALNGAAGASTLTVDGFAGAGGGLAVAHSGTSPTQAEVILLTRNILISGASSSLQAYIDIKATATVDVDWTEFKWLGSATTNKRGIDVATTTGSCSIQYSSIHDFLVASSRGFLVTGSGFSAVTFSNNVTYNINGAHFIIPTTTGSWTADTNIFMLNASGAGNVDIVTINDIGGTFTNITVVGGTSVTQALSISENSIIPAGTFNNISSHSNAGNGFNISCSSLLGMLTVSNLTVWRNNTYGFNPNSSANIIFDTITLFGNATGNMFVSSIRNVYFYNPTLSGDTTFSTPTGIVINGSSFMHAYLKTASFGVVTGIKTAHTTADFGAGNSLVGSMLFLDNTILASSSEGITSIINTPDSVVYSQKHDQTAGLHKTWKKYGIITADSTIFKTGAPSQRLTPNNASNKLKSGIKKVAVASGATVTINAYMRESVVGDGTDYNGNRPRLILLRNDAMGITSDTVIDTGTIAAEGAWEQLTGTTGAAPADGILEFIVDCDGTTGWINVDDWTVS